MFATYRQILALPGATAFTAAGLVARLPNSMTGLGIVLLISATSGSYGLAGVVAGAYTLAAAIGGPVTARIADRFTQHLVLLPGLAVSNAGLAAIVIAALLGAPAWVLITAAVLAGLATPSIGSMIRARWAGMLRGDGRLQTAFALEAIIDEVVFIIGPILVTALDAGVPGSGLGSAAGLALLGGGALAALRSTEPPGAAGQRGRGTRTRPAPALWLIVGIAVCLGAVFASADVSVVAAADEAGRRAVAGLVLATLAAGSLVSATVYGSVRWRRPPEVRAAVSLLMLAAALPLMAVAPSLPLLTLAAFVTGVGVAPSLIAAMSLTERLVPAESLTEGIALATAGVALGLTVGAMVAGRAVDAAGSTAGFLVAVVAGALAAASAVGGRRWITGSIARREAGPPVRPTQQVG